MKQLAKNSLVLLLSIFAFLTSISPVTAAPSSSQNTMKIQVTIEDAKDFWSYPYINRDSEVLKPSFIAVEWSIGDLGRNQTRITIITQGNVTGELPIITEQNALVNLRIMVCDSKGNIIGTSSGLENNRGQTKAYTITVPDLTEPKITIN